MLIEYKMGHYTWQGIQTFTLGESGVKTTNLSGTGTSF